MLKYYQIKKTLHYKGYSKVLDITYKILDESDMPAQPNYTITWANILEHKSEIEELTGWPAHLDKKYKRFWINHDWLVRERFNPDLLIAIDIEYSEQIPSLKDLFEYNNWIDSYNYIQEQLKNN